MRVDAYVRLQFNKKANISDALQQIVVKLDIDVTTRKNVDSVAKSHSTEKQSSYFLWKITQIYSFNCVLSVGNKT